MEKVSYEKLIEGQFLLSSQDRENVYEEISLEELLNPDKAVHFLNEYSKQMKALNKQVPATYFFSMFGITCSSFLAMLGLHHVVVPITLHSISVQLYRNEQYQSNTMAFKLNNTDWETGAGSVEWRRQHISSLFKTTVTPLLDQLSEQVSIRPRELWGQLLNGLEYGKKVALNLATTDKERKVLQEDFHWLTKEANHELFNSLKNRLDFPLIEIENPTVPGQMQRLKATCCLYYQTEGSKGKCYTCPRMTTSEREQRKKEIIAEITR
jgi:ferric iron reductase protein FhuF